MRVVDVVARRATILGLAEDGRPAAEIARQVGCDGRIVQAALRVGEPVDRRKRPRGRTDPDVVAAIAELAAEGRACGDIVELVVGRHGPGAADKALVARLARRYRGPRPPAPRLEAADLAAAEAAPESLEPEIRLLRAYLRVVGGWIGDRRQAERRRARLITLSAELVGTLVRAEQLGREAESADGGPAPGPAGSTGASAPGRAGSTGSSGSGR